MSEHTEPRQPEASFVFDRVLDEKERHWISALMRAFMDADAVPILAMLTPEQLLKIAQSLIPDEPSF